MTRCFNKRIGDHFEVGTPFARDEPPVRRGQFEISPARIRCDESHVLRIRYYVGAEGIAVGGGIQIFFPGVQTEEPEGKGYLTVSSSRPGVRFWWVHKMYPRVYITTPETLYPNAHWHAAVVEGEPLREGDVIDFTIGTEQNPRRGPLRLQKWMDRRQTIECYLDSAGDGIYRRLSNSPVLEVEPQIPRLLRAFLPSTVLPEETLAVRAVVTDPFGNPVDLTPPIELSRDGQVWTPVLQAPENGLVRVWVRTSRPEIGLEKRRPRGVESEEETTFCNPPLSNPVRVTRAGDDRLFWGDIHCHSSFSNDVQVQGLTHGPEDCFRFARDVSGLDFACVTDHYEPVFRTWGPMLERGIGLTETLWERSKEAADIFYEPGRFLTLFGYEYRTPRGDTNLYFIDREEAVLLPSSCDSIRRVRDFLWGKRFFMSPHLHPYSHPYLTLGPWKWGKQVLEEWNDPGGEEEPIIEIYSRHGRYEFYGNQPLQSPRRGMTEGNSVQAHLLRGHRFGFYAASDDHWGRPGEDGLMAVFAPELTREALFKAIQRRRCYATTGARILLDFRVNDCFMGESIHMDQPTRIRAEVHGTDCLAAVELIRDGRIWHRLEPGEPDCVFEYEDPKPVLGTCFYYLRVLQCDQHMAWSSPVWLTSSRPLEDMHGDLS